MILAGLILFASCSEPTDYSSAKWLVWRKDSVSHFPGANWKQYQNPVAAGWSEELLQIAKKEWERSESSAFLVVYDGAVLAAWGETDRRFLVHSVRKSLDNALYGIAIDQDLVDLNSTLAELNITEVSELTPEERQAKVHDLIRARSGIYLPAAYSLNQDLPGRGSAKPGERWFYNNWDFNVNQTIIEQQTGVPIEEYFQDKVAKPLGMQDFRLMDVYDHQEVRSVHPAHPYRMSARDLARFGLLYLNQGNWKGHQVIPKEWVLESIQPHSRLSREEIGYGTDYGYLWWISDDRFKDLDMYYASGLNGQRVRVIPAANMVIVNLVNTYKRQNFFELDQLDLIDKVLAARISPPELNPELVEIHTKKTINSKYDSIGKEYLGTYKAPWNPDRAVDEIQLTIEYRPEGLIADIQYGGTFKMLKVADHRWIMEDMDNEEEQDFPMTFFKDASGKPAFKLKLALILEEVIFRKS